MLSKLDIGEDHIVAFRWEGEFDEMIFNQGIVHFLLELESRDKLNLYLEISDVNEVDPKEVGEKLNFPKNYLQTLKMKIEKVALVTNKTWVSDLAENYLKYAPHIEHKTFSFAEADSAMLFVKE